MSTENLKVVLTGDASGLDAASEKALAALDKIAASAAALDAKLSALGGSGSGAGIVSAVQSVETLDASLETLGKTASRISVVMPSIMADRGQTITIGAKAVDDLNTSLQTVGNTVSKVTSEWDSFAKAPFVSLAAQAEAFDNRARRLNNTINYTDRSMKDLGTSAKNLIPVTVVPAVEHMSQSLTKMNRASASSTNSLFALSGIVQDAPYGFRAIANNITFFTQQMAYSAKASGGFGAALKGMGAALTGPAGIIFAISAGVSLLDTFLGSAKKGAPEIDALADKLKSLRDGLKSITEVRGDTIASAAKETAELRLLYNAATDVTRSQEERYAAAKKLQQTQPKTFGAISQLKIISGEAAGAFDKLSASILKVAQANVVLQEMEKNLKTIGDAQKDLDKAVDPDKYRKLTDEYLKQKNTLDAMSKSASVSALMLAQQGAKVTEAQKKISDYLNTIGKFRGIQDQANASNQKLQDSFNALDFKDKGDKASGAGKKLKTVAQILDDLAAKTAELNAKQKITGLTIEQLGANKMKDLSDAMNALARISTPEAIAKAKELGAQYDKIGKASFLPTLTGGRTQVNAPGITKPGVPNTTTGDTPTSFPISDPKKFGKLQDEIAPLVKQIQQLGIFSDRTLSNLQTNLTKNADAAGILGDAFGEVFNALANGQNPFKALLASVEQLIIQLGITIGLVAVLNAIPGGSAVLKALDIVGGLASATPKFASGGFVNGPTMAVIGDAPGGEWVLNQKQISAILNGSGGGRNINITGTLTGEGSTLKAIIDTTGRKQGRRG